MSTDLVPYKDGNISIHQEREDEPRFKRMYSGNVTPSIRIKVGFKSTRGLGRWGGGELTQPNGRWVLFDPKAVADKILDPNLVPLVEAWCAEAWRLDKEFMDGLPTEFIDEGGKKWIRADALPQLAHVPPFQSPAGAQKQAENVQTVSKPGVLSSLWRVLTS